MQSFQSDLPATHLLVAADRAALADLRRFTTYIGYNPVMDITLDAPSTNEPGRTTLRTIRKWMQKKQTFPMLTCYDATTAGWLWRGGVRCFLVGDTAAQVILGHDSTLPAPMRFMLEITAAVRRGAPDAFIMADMPFGSYQCGDDAALRNAVRFVKHAQADAVKLEVDDTHGELVSRMAHAGVPVVAHIGSRPQHVRADGGYRAAGRTSEDAEKLVKTAKIMLVAGAMMLLVEAVPAEVSQRIVELTEAFSNGRSREGGNPAENQIAGRTPLDSRLHGNDAAVPVIGCGAGPACHGHVVVLQDLLGMTDWQPPFAKPIAQIGRQLQETAAKWANTVQSGAYLKEDHPYRMKE